MDIQSLTSRIPAEITFLTVFKFIGILALCAIVASALIRLFFGKHSPLNRALSAAVGILGIYVMTVVIYTFRPAGLEQWLSPLPFVKFSGENLYILSFSSAPFSVICSEILSMVILAVLYHIADSLMPDAKTGASWLLLRLATVCLAIGIHFALDMLTDSFLPEQIINYAPTILLILLVLSLLGGILGVLLGLVLTVIHPVLGILCGFFFSSRIGKEISKAMLTTAILCVLVAVLAYFSFSIICISPAALLSDIPLLAALMALWYVIDCKL